MVKANGVIVLTALLTMASRSLALTCLPCFEYSCDRPPTCSYGLVTDICACCYICAKGPGEECGGIWGMAGTCGDGMDCVLDEKDIPLDDPNIPGHCVSNVIGCPETGPFGCAFADFGKCRSTCKDGEYEVSTGSCGDCMCCMTSSIGFPPGSYYGRRYY